MTRVKICGITNARDAFLAVEAEAHALGFVFAESPRYIAATAARDIVRRLPPFVVTVGVFVDRTLVDLERSALVSAVSHVQLHGQESGRYCKSVSRPVIKRLRITDANAATEAMSMMNSSNVVAFLLDPGAGNGQMFDWAIAAELKERLSAARPDAPPALILAGGLNPDNVAEAIRLVRPYAVDVCSGVEASPGRKDPQKLRAFLSAVEECNAEYAP